MKQAYYTKKNIAQKAKDILGEVQKINNFQRKKAENRFILENSALIVLDMQKYFTHPSSHAYIPSSEAIIPNIQNLIKYFSRQNRPIVFTKHLNNPKNAKNMKKWWNDVITKENDFSTLTDEIQYKNAIIIEKSQYDAFYETKLDKILKENNIEQIVITGVMTHLCCETTARSAFIKDFEPFFIIDGCATYNEEFHKASILNLSHGFSIPTLTEEILCNK